MKVKRINKSSKHTNQIIKETFAELMSEKKELTKIKVTELVERAGITRSSFYTHYDSINDVASEIQEETLEVLMKDTENITDLQDADKYLDEITNYLKEHDAFYSLLLSSDEPLYFTNNLNKIVSKKLYDALSKNNIKNLELNVHFFTNGCMDILIKYYRKEISSSLDDISAFYKFQFKKIFFE